MATQARQQQQWMMSAQAQTHYHPPSTATPTASSSSLPYHQPTTLEVIRTLWIGSIIASLTLERNVLKVKWDLDRKGFVSPIQVVSIKVIRNKITSQPEGYGFVEFNSHAAAERVLQTYNGTQMPGTEQTFRLNWASFGIGERRPDARPEHSIFVGDLAPDVTDYLLQETFRTQYPSVRGAKVVTDPNTGRSKGYGFVKFADEMERNRAMSEMNGVYCSTRQMRISAATPKKTTGFQQQYAAARALYPPPAYTPAVFIGNLDSNVTEEELRQIFLQFGEIIYVKIPTSRGCGFVQFIARASAEEAIQRMQGTMIGQQAVHLSWGRSPTAKQDLPGVWSQQADPSQWSSTYYGYGQGYDAYGYGTTHDPSLYAYGAYPGFAQYPQQVEGSQEMASMAGAVPAVEQREEYDPLATPDVDKKSNLRFHVELQLVNPGIVLKVDMEIKFVNMLIQDFYFAFRQCLDYGFEEGFVKEKEKWKEIIDMISAKFATSSLLCTVGDALYKLLYMKLDVPFSFLHSYVEGSQEMASMAGAVPAVEQREEYDPLATPDVDKMRMLQFASWAFQDAHQCYLMYSSILVVKQEQIQRESI
ncbi:hypothetical protein TEA_006462 [Camellia sinensis var. sinensis]|uniref:RRM domain-containing protein n=1 Tax=Camellia sinensis var. sinensis TaxID=542762 RepID=A0A4S4F1P6_CAMSN|nr:hypothetical protein TEA_006462 [Camellia sinensis var. sinensis]